MDDLIFLPLAGDGNGSSSDGLPLRFALPESGRGGMNGVGEPDKPFLLLEPLLDRSRYSKFFLKYLKITKRKKNRENNR